MNSGSALRFQYRHMPADRIASWGIMVALLAGVGIWFLIERSWAAAAVLLALAAFGLLRILLFRTLWLLVNGDGLTVIRRPMMRVGGSFDFFAAERMRVIRYRSELHDQPSSDTDAKETRYIIDLITRDGQIVKLIESSEIAPPRNLAKRLAAELGTQYEEYLDDGTAA